MAWLFNDEATPKTVALLNRLRTETALVPARWFIEVTNVLAMAERKGRITPAQSDAFVADIDKLEIERDDEAPDRAFTHILALCRTHAEVLKPAVSNFEKRDPGRLENQPRLAAHPVAGARCLLVRDDRIGG